MLNHFWGFPFIHNINKGYCLREFVIAIDFELLITVVAKKKMMCLFLAFVWKELESALTQLKTPIDVIVF